MKNNISSEKHANNESATFTHEEPTVGAYMTATIHTVGADQKIQVAEEMMKKYGFHHLPVLRAGELMGIVSDRDIQFAYRLAPDANDFVTADIMQEEPYIVSPSEPLSKVLGTMTERRIGSALVVNPNGKLEGIFTNTDVMKICLDFFDISIPDLSDDSTSP